VEGRRRARPRDHLDQPDHRAPNPTGIVIPTAGAATGAPDTELVVAEQLRRY
jgi:hypothetical protein